MAVRARTEVKIAEIMEEDARHKTQEKRKKYALFYKNDSV
jgi:hypothetical protein